MWFDSGAFQAYFVTLLTTEEYQWYAFSFQFQFSLISWAQRCGVIWRSSGIMRKLTLGLLWNLLFQHWLEDDKKYAPNIFFLLSQNNPTLSLIPLLHSLFKAGIFHYLACHVKWERGAALLKNKSQFNGKSVENDYMLLYNIATWKLKIATMTATEGIPHKAHTKENFNVVSRSGANPHH